MKNSILALIIVAVLVVLVGIIGIFVFHITEMAGIFSGVLFIATAINQYTGLNIWLARAVALPLLFFGVYWYGIKNILSPKGKKLTGYVSLTIVWMVACLAMYLSQGNFARTSESENLQALRYYFIDNKGQIVIRDHKGVDADTGLELKPITPEIWRQYELQQEDVLFDPKTGEARKRYYKAKDGTITLFPLETLYHPEYGTKLEKITEEIAQQVKKKTIPPKDDIDLLTKVKALYDSAAECKAQRGWWIPGDSNRWVKGRTNSSNSPQTIIITGSGKVQYSGPIWTGPKGVIERGECPQPGCTQWDSPREKLEAEGIGYPSWNLPRGTLIGKITNGSGQFIQEFMIGEFYRTTLKAGQIVWFTRNDNYVVGEEGGLCVMVEDAS